jgi:hypothetical protein
MRNIFAWTAPGAHYPEFVSINEQDDGSITIDVRGPKRPPDKDHPYEQCGETVRMTLPTREVANMARALVCEVIPADIATGP